MRKVLRFMLMLSIPMAFSLGCQDDDADTDFTKDVPVVVRFSDGKESLLFDEEQVIEIGVTLSVAQENPVEVTYDVISNTAIEGQDFNLQSPRGTVVIPAQETSGKIIISLIDGSFDDGGKSFLLKMTGTTINDADVSPTNVSFPTIIVEFAECPTIKDDEFVGDYLMEMTSSPHAFGATFDNQVVTLSQGEGTVRSFEAKYLPSQGFSNPPMTVTFDFSCGETLPFEGLETNLFCGGPITLEPSEDKGAYVLGGSDGEFTLMMTDLNPNGCGGLPPAFPISFKFTKQ